MKNSTTKNITYTGITMALVFIGTYVVRIPTPLTNGYIHLGDAFVLLAGLILGPFYGALAAGIGSALADILSGYAQWAGPTFLIKALMAVIIGLLAIKKDNRKVIFGIGLVFSLFWVAFNMFLRYMISGDTTVDVTTLTPSISEGIQNKLLLIALIVPVFMAILLIVFKLFASTKFNLHTSVGFIIAGSVMVVAYYLAASLMYGNFIVPILDIPANILQFLFGLLIAHLLMPFAKKATLGKYNNE